ncbi:fungal specific transcription factor domain-containing protein [Colletotrichum orchidophilum]|uniref:Fungal specific transcription factor domain-containing protein n=1 Tax=Colletotrichum orchidophilum TaxID=1209926 RepID=A0A1G4BET2_9PEZI|nr:fungal specific transcription factor domain-containing protein [Colletotrichum orchidophilum]OHE99847.1 fungal specific transcription factor domain-containing protein [Colletotrichum orchidophilum]
MAPETIPPEASKPKSQNKVRKRAPKACLSCRARKVRCDVSQRGRPCMNCYLDSENCVVTGRASRFRRAQQVDGADTTEGAYPPYDADAGEQLLVVDPITTTSNDSRPVPSNEPDAQPQTCNHSHGDDISIPTTAERSESPVLINSNTQHDHPKPSYRARSSVASTSTYEAFPSNSLPLNNQPFTTPYTADQRNTMGIDVTYSFYPFLALGNLHGIPPQDVNYLELQGCLRVPTRTILDELVQQYFLHVHPLLPMVNEGDFWDVYCVNPAGYVPSDKISLLVFQAMLFASCNFVSRQTIKTLGFPTIRAARAAFYRRAKLLYDLESESSPLAISQASLLLSFWSSPTSPAFRKSNTAWLSIAIQNAKMVEAHHYATRTASPKKRNLLKRLWWCCILRDRIVGLGLRRSLQITRSHFTFDANESLGFSDLADEIERSRVYNPGTKRCLAEILEQLVELCVVLTDILILVFPLDDRPGWGREMRAEEQDKVRVCKVALQRWYKGVTLRFPMFGGGSVARIKTPGNEFQHDSVILYTNLMYMYYHSSRVVLSHHEVLHLAITAAAPSFNAIPTSDLVIIGENRHELQDAASGVTECLKELIHLRLARWLPISAVACTALPLVLHILDVKLSASSRSFDPNTQSALKQHRLNILIEAMKTYQPQYDGVDWVSETIRHIVNLAQIDSPARGETANATPGGAVIADWTDILASQPSSYLRLALTMDLSLSKGRLPEDGDFPVSLQGLFTGGFNPLKALLERKRKESRDASVGLSEAAEHAVERMTDFDAAAMRVNLFRMQPGTVTAIPSDEGSTSPASAGSHSQDSVTDDTSPQTGAEYQSSCDVTMTDHPPSEGIDGLAAEVLAAFPLDDQSASVDGDFDGMYFDGMPGHDGPGGWIETAWNELAQHSSAAAAGGRSGEDRTDRDTARVLLDALREGELAECAA